MLGTAKERKKTPLRLVPKGVFIYRLMIFGLAPGVTHPSA